MCDLISGPRNSVKFDSGVPRLECARIPKEPSRLPPYMVRTVETARLSAPPLAKEERCMLLQRGFPVLCGLHAAILLRC